MKVLINNKEQDNIKAIQVDNFPTYEFMGLEPTLKRDIKLLNNLREKLNITEPQEDFVLKCILDFERRKDCVLYDIEKIKKSKSLDMIDFRVRVKLPSGTTDYCVSNPLKEEGWRLNTHSERCWSVWHQLHKYICSKK